MRDRYINFYNLLSITKNGNWFFIDFSNYTDVDHFNWPGGSILLQLPLQQKYQPNVDMGRSTSNNMLIPV